MLDFFWVEETVLEAFGMRSWVFLLVVMWMMTMIMTKTKKKKKKY